MRPLEQRSSLEELVEAGDIDGLEVLHPGGLEITRELADLCRISSGVRLLDVASGTGESACFLAEAFHCSVVGVDISRPLTEMGGQKAAARRLNVRFVRGDAQQLPFVDDSFDVVISECTVCMLDKERTLAEMARVARPAGCVAIHDVCWREDTPQGVKERLAALEGERPLPLAGWQRLFEEAGLAGVMTLDRSILLAAWTKEIRSRLGIIGQLRILSRVLKRSGIRGVGAILAAERIFGSRYTGYGIVVGRKAGPVAAR